MTPKELDLGSVACGAASKEGSISIRNDTNVPAEYEAKLPDGSVFALRDAKGVIPPKDVGFVYVSATPTSGEKYNADVVIKIGSTLSQVAAKVAARGGMISLTPAIIDFGEVRQNTKSAPISIDLKNAGSEDVTVESFGALPKEVAITPLPVAVPAGQTVKVNATFNAGPFTDPAVSTSLTLKTIGAMCGAVQPVALKGKSVNQDVTVNPLAAAFGDQPCTSTPSAKPTITVANYSTSNGASFTATLLSGAASRFTVTPASGNVGSAPGATPATQKITIAAKQVGLPLGNVNEQLEVKVDSPAQGMKTSIVNVTMLAYGAILELTPNGQLSGFAPNETKSWTITNKGNNSVNVNYSLTGSGFSVEPDDFIMASDDLRVTFTAANPGTYNATVVWSYGFFGGGPFCTTPPTATMTGTR